MFTVTVKTLDEANLILLGLGELPAKMSMALIGEVQKQVQKQVDDLQKPTQAAKDA